ncbi:MAG: alkaline phosphatase family protein, partial [Pirellulales bacterium]
CLAAHGSEPRVLIIGIDGAGGRYGPAADTPNIDSLVANGAARFDFYNEGGLVQNPPPGYGASGVNWSTIVTGASAEHHGVTDNSFAGSKFNNYPHFFKYIQEHDPTSYRASIVSWEPINSIVLADQFASLEREFPGLTSAQQDALVRDTTVDLMRHGDPDAIFLHFDQVDAAGHGSGWGTPQYNTALATVDGYIGNIMTAMNQRPGVVSGAEDWLVIVTADHGGLGLGHDASQGPINWEVPFIVSGNSVADGTTLGRGTLRDVVPTALWHLGIDPFALGLDGTVRGLVVTPPNGILGDVNQDGLVTGDGRGPTESDDVSAFVAGWLSQGSGSIAERCARGDLNFDGITNLGDWAILNNASPALGQAAFRRVIGVPEPASVVLLSFPVMWLTAHVRGGALRN